MSSRHVLPGHSRLQQRGAVLVTSLMILLVMTVISVTGVQTSILGEKMAGNYRDASLAFQAAEAALRDAETDIRTNINGLTGFNSSCTSGLCDATGGLSEVWETQAANGVALGGHTGTASLALVACQPKYWIEGYRVWPPGNADWRAQYRVTAVACGGNSNTKVVLQTVHQ